MRNICIIGKGSIGVRHAKIFNQLGCKIYFLRTKKNLKNYKLNFKYTEFFNFRDIKRLKFDLYVISNPTSLHFNILKKIVKKKINILIEKPLVAKKIDLKIIKKILKSHKANIFMGYMLRFDKRILFLKEKLKKDFKYIKHANFTLKTYMPNWHTGENYLNSYAAQKRLGGGVILTCSHEIDLAVFLFGPASQVYCKEFKTFLKTDVENSVMIVIKHKNGIISNLVLDFASKKIVQRNIEINLNNYSLEWDFYKKKIKKNLFGKSKYFSLKKNQSLDQIYYDQNQYILNNLNKKFNIKNFDKIFNIEETILSVKNSLNKGKLVTI